MEAHSFNEKFSYTLFCRFTRKFFLIQNYLEHTCITADTFKEKKVALFVKAKTENNLKTSNMGYYAASVLGTSKYMISRIYCKWEE